MTLDKLYTEINTHFNTDISLRSREMLVATARYVFYIEARKLFYTLQQIADKCDKSHAMVWYALKLHEDRMSCKGYYRNTYNSFVNRNIIEEVVEVKQKVSKLSDSQSSLLSDLKQLSDSDILEFRETRLKPYLNMLKTRRKPKHIPQVIGARLR